MKPTKILTTGLALLALLPAVMPTADATDPRVCLPSDAEPIVCAGGASTGSPACGYSEDSVIVSSPTGGNVRVIASSRCSNSGHTEARRIAVTAYEPGVGLGQVQWFGSETDGVAGSCTGFVSWYSEPIDDFQSVPVGCPAGAPPDLPYGNLVPALP